MPELPELVQALLKPQAYPELPAKIELMQTQMSFVFIAGEYVYKVKKSVNLGYLDYTTLEKRHALCKKEVELNQRLCPETYIGVVPITKVNGIIHIGGNTKPIEYAVKMRYLPPDRMLNVLLDKNEVTPDMMERLANRLVVFHAKAETNDTISAFGSLDAVTTNAEENFSQTEGVIGNTVSQEKYERIRDWTLKFIKDNAALFRKRVADGKIRDCHGDLHAQHICFVDNICIYDCIEFNDRFRYCDVASEIAFTAMDLDHYGRADLSRAFVDAYIAGSKDNEIRKLLNYYKCYRAYVRGKVEGFKLADPYISETEKQRIRGVAAAYYDLADAYIRKKPLLMITTGVTGTGKSTVAQALAKRLGLVVISSDVTRKTLAGIPLTEHHFEGFTGGIYTPEFSRKTYDTMFAQAESILNDKGSVILDGAFLKAGERVTARELAKKTKADFLIVECTAPEGTVRQWLNERMKGPSVSDGRWEIYEPQKKLFEPVTEVPPSKHIVINTASVIDDIIEEILRKFESVPRKSKGE